MKRHTNPSWSIALCGMVVALSVVLMLLGAIIPIAMFIAPAVGGVFIGFVAIECGRRYAWTTYGAASLLGLLFVPDKETALFFVALLGYYPLVKPQGGGENIALQWLGPAPVWGADAVFPRGRDGRRTRSRRPGDGGSHPPDRECGLSALR